MNRLVPFVLLAAAAGACGDKSRKPGTTPAADAAPSSTADAPPAAGMPAADPAPALPARTCPPAHAATLGQCSDGIQCVLLLAIDEKCIVKVANEIDIPDIASVSDGAGLSDLTWPKKDGPLYLVNMASPTWAWAELPSPLTAARDALGKVTWTPTKVGDTEPEGFQYGLVTDGAKPILAGCTKWGDHCSPDAEECEEWHCTKHLFLDPHTKKKLAKAPALPFVAGPKSDKITDAIALGKKGKEKTCDVTSDSAPPETWYDNALDGSIALSSTDWLALRYAGGSRMSAKWDLDVTYYRGCSDAYGVVEGRLVLGPNKLWARSTEGGWELQHGPLGAPLTDATGKIKAFGDGPLVFAVD